MLRRKYAVLATVIRGFDLRDGLGGFRGVDYERACFCVRLQSRDQFGAGADALRRRERADRARRIYAGHLPVQHHDGKPDGSSDCGPATRRRAPPLSALQVTQNIFTGFRVRNGVKQAEVGVLASREVLRNTVQNVLFDAAQAYMDVLRDTAILDIRRRNVLFLEEQVRAANERFNVGENTRTDVAQARARLASARAAVSLAQANLATSQATYRQVIGHDPQGLADGFPYGRLVPATLPEAIDVGEDAHPLILAAIHQADAQAFAVKQAEGELLPRSASRAQFSTTRAITAASIRTRRPSQRSVSIPLYAGGAAYGGAPIEGAIRAAQDRDRRRA